MKHLIAKRTAMLAGVVGLALTLVVPGTVLAQPSKDDPTLANVDGGKVRGTAEKDVIVFKGIPFAQPPVGALRWRSPQPVKPWKGIRDAKEFGPNPMQPKLPPLPVLTGPMAAKTSEDCLYLNVFRPAASSDKPLPVMVYVFGGSLVFGSASQYPGEGLARQGVIVVTINYRIGRLGFFAHPALAHEAPDDVRGNYGYMDQLAALKWVQKNIAAFGGDPKNVTLGGVSAGGGSVLVHLTSPLSRGLFHRAILESPGIPTPRRGSAPMRSLASAESIAVEYARAAGIKGDDKATLEALRALPAEKLIEGLEGYHLAITGGPEVSGLSHSIIDGRLVVEPPEATLRAGKQAPVPVIVGATDADLAVGPSQTKDGLFAAFGPLAPQARKLYDPKGNADFKVLFQVVVGDQLMREPSRNLAELVTTARQPVYFYRFAYVPEDQRGKLPGAIHGMEVGFALSYIPDLIKDATKADLDMCRTMSGYWVDFIKTGDPNGGGRTKWPRYDTTTRDVLNFTNTGVTYGPDPAKERLDLWRAVWERGR